MAEIFGEAARPQELVRYADLDPMRDGAFDDITALVAKFFQAPIAVIRLLHGDGMRVKSIFGDLSLVGCDLEVCLSATTTSKVAPGGERTGPGVANDNGFRFHASTPLRSLDGHHLGTLSIIDLVPRTFSRADEQMLARFGRLVMAQIEQRLASREIADLLRDSGRPGNAASHAATIDARTGLLTRGAIMSHLQALYDRADDNPRVATLLFDVDHLQTVNDMYGQAGGDAVLAEVALRIQDEVRLGDHVGRFGGAEFLVILVDCDRQLIASIAERIRQSVERTRIRYVDRDICVSVSAGVYLASGRIGSEAALKGADDALSVAKREGRNRVVFNRSLAEAMTVSA